MRLGTYYRWHLLRRLGLHRVSGRVLDIGCFDGFWAASLEGAEPHGVDVDLQPLYRIVRYVRASGMRLPFKDGVFDTVFAIDVIEHVPDERELIMEALRVLRPTGRVILTTPNSTISVFPKVLQPWIDKQWGHHRVRGFSVGYLRGLLEELPLSDVSITPLAISAFRWGYVLLRLVWALPGPLGGWIAAAAAAWDARHLKGDRGTVLVQITR